MWVINHRQDHWPKLSSSFRVEFPLFELLVSWTLSLHQIDDMQETISVSWLFERCQYTKG